MNLLANGRDGLERSLFACDLEDCCADASLFGVCGSSGLLVAGDEAIMGSKKRVKRASCLEGAVWAKRETVRAGELRDERRWMVEDDGWWKTSKRVEIQRGLEMANFGFRGKCFLRFFIFIFAFYVGKADLT